MPFSSVAPTLTPSLTPQSTTASTSKSIPNTRPVSPPQILGKRSVQDTNNNLELGKNEGEPITKCYNKDYAKKKRYDPLANSIAVMAEAFKTRCAQKTEPEAINQDEDQIFLNLIGSKMKKLKTPEKDKFKSNVFKLLYQC